MKKPIWRSEWSKSEMIDLVGDDRRRSETENRTERNDGWGEDREKQTTGTTEAGRSYS